MSSLTLTTAATGDQVDPSTFGDDLEESVAVGIPAADLVTVKTLASGDATPDEGDVVTFEIAVTNNGPDAATNVFADGLASCWLDGDCQPMDSLATARSLRCCDGHLWTIGTTCQWRRPLR